ncbi:ATP-binding protein [Paenibacillus daejeonensis]|uniref:ATP-binding protein n=1 Tax=Paenibacillus daejeonensis TaxID=135193 RepID=UPI00035CE186|nr:ATP-binding protein [Paenibacillus daejeonensis]
MTKLQTPYIYRRVLPILLLCMLLLLGGRWLWNERFGLPEEPYAVQGFLDLGESDLWSKGPFSLDGEWLFYPNQLLSREDINHSREDVVQVVTVPGSWDQAFPSSGSYGYGTYRLLVLLDSSLEEISLWNSKIQSSVEIEINGQLVLTLGKTEAIQEKYTPERQAFTVPYALQGATELDILIRVANFDDPYSGGITRSIYLGSSESVAQESGISLDLQKTTFILLLLHAIYAFILFCFHTKQRALFYFSMLSLFAALLIATDHDVILSSWLPFNFTWLIKLKTISYVLFSCFLLAIARNLIHANPRSVIYFLYRLAISLFILFVLFVPIEFVYAAVHYRLSDLLYILPMITALYLFMKMALERHKDAMYLLIAASSAISSAVWGIIHGLTGSSNYMYYPIDIIAAIVALSAYWIKQYFRNVMEIRELNQKLQSEIRHKDQFLANTAHELRTPLHGMISIAHQASEDVKSDKTERQQERMQDIVRIGRRMSQLVEDLLDMVRLRESRIILNKEHVSLQAVISGVIDMLSFMIEGKDVQLTSTLQDQELEIHADERRLVQILYNLVDNAIKFTPKGQITVSGERNGDHIIVTVLDTGIGMREFLLEHIFEPYEQGSDEIRTSRGLGLGLSIVKQLVELHGGEIQAASSPGAGTSIQLMFPYVASPERRAVPASMQTVDNSLPSIHHASVEDSGPRAHANLAQILAVDDDPINLKVLAGMLSGRNYHLVTVTSPNEVLQQLQNRRWDLLIADVMMPGMSGYELTRQVRERFSISELPILLLTARGTPTDIYTGFLAGASDYVMKPVDAVELKHRIASLIHLKQSVDERLRMEAAYLQAQIQPHFFFNTLNAIMALSHMDIPRMQQLSDAFITYLQTSFNFMNTEEVVPIEHELELVRNYLYIEQERYQHRLNVVWDIPEELELLLPPLTIQPLVENAVGHGIAKSLKHGTLTIRIMPKGSLVTIEVLDDGVGMEQQVIDDALKWPGDHPGKKRGIGLSNIHRRLLQIYGRGLTIRSNRSNGTEVTFDIPLYDDE